MEHFRKNWMDTQNTLSKLDIDYSAVISPSLREEIVLENK